MKETGFASVQDSRPTGRERSRRNGLPISAAILLLLFLATVPAWALLTYPGWMEWAVGYFPYYNLHAWMAHPRPVWTPPYSVRAGIPALAWSEALSFLFQRAGMGPLAALRTVTMLALLMGTLGVYLWQRRWWGEKPALAAALLWLYAPVSLYTAYHLGFIGTLWLAAACAWLLWRFVPHPPARGWMGISALAALLAWSVRVWLPPLSWSWWVLAQGMTLVAVPAVGWTFHRWRQASPLPILLTTALAAILVVPWAQPHYLSVTPPPQPTAIFGQHSVVLLDAQVMGEIKPGSTLQVSTDWQVLKPQRTDWTIFVQVLDETNTIRGQFDAPLGGETHPTRQWRVGEVGSETATLTIAADAPSRLHLILGLYDRETLTRLPTVEGRDHVELR